MSFKHFRNLVKLARMNAANGWNITNKERCLIIEMDLIESVQRWARWIRDNMGLETKINGLNLLIYK